MLRAMKTLTSTETVKYEGKNKTLGPERQMSGARKRVKLWIWAICEQIRHLWKERDGGLFNPGPSVRLNQCHCPVVTMIIVTIFPHLSKSQGFVQKVKVGIYAMHCNVWPALICGSWAECVKDWSLENGKMMRWSWFWKMRSYSSSYDGEW